MGVRTICNLLIDQGAKTGDALHFFNLKGKFYIQHADFNLKPNCFAGEDLTRGEVFLNYKTGEVTNEV